MKKGKTTCAAVLSVCVAASVFLGSCAKDGVGVKLVLDWTPNTNHTGFYVAQAKGFYNDEGIDVTIEQGPDDEALSLVAAGKGDFGVTAQESVAGALTADVPLPITAVAAMIQHNTSGIISLAENGIKSPKDMEGHNYGTWDLPIEKAIIKECVEADGGNYENVVMIPNTVSDVVSALQTDIDSVWVFYGWEGVAAEVEGLDTNFFYFRDFAPELDFYTPVLVAENTYLEQNGDLSKRFLRATQKGYEYAANNPEEAADIFCKAVPEANRDIVLSGQNFLAGEYIAEAPYWGYITPARWNAFSNWLFDKGIISKPLGENQGFTNDYLQ